MTLLRLVLRQAGQRQFLGGEFDGLAPVEDGRCDIRREEPQADGAGEVGWRDSARRRWVGDGCAVARKNEIPESLGTSEEPQEAAIGLAVLVNAPSEPSRLRSLSSSRSIRNRGASPPIAR